MVFAAASLTGPFEQIARDFESVHPDVTVELQFAGSQQLVAQLDQGATADVLVTADDITMRRAVEAAVVEGEPHLVARNQLVVAVAAGNPRGIRSLADLAADGVDVALAAPEVPAGRYSRLALEKAGVAVKPRTEEPSVKAVLTKVELGEAHAGVVYVSDLHGRDRLDAVPIPDEHNVEARYLAATTAAAQNPRIANDFIRHLNEGRGQAALERAGFRRA